MVGIEYLLQKRLGAPWDNISIGIVVAIIMYGRLSLTRMTVRNLNKRYKLNENDYLQFAIGASLDMINIMIFNIDNLTDQNIKMNDQVQANYNR